MTIPARLRTAFLFFFVNIAIIVIPLIFFLKTHDGRFEFIPLPLSMIVNCVIIAHSKREVLLRKNNA